MSSLNHLSRRCIIICIAILPFFLALYFLSSAFLDAPRQGKGYLSPSRVLPSYTSPNSIPACLPEKVDGYLLKVGRGDSQGRVGNWLDPSRSEWAEWESTIQYPTEGAEEEGVKGGDSVPVTGIASYIYSHIKALQSGFDPKADQEYLGLDVGSSWDLKSYHHELMTTFQTYLSIPTVPLPSFIPPVLSRLSLRTPLAPLPARPNQILTTDKHKSVDELPWEFARWKEIMPDWEIKYFDDDKLEQWVQDMFGGSRAQEIWKGLPRAVLKADVFRYMAMLVEGGIYTDSDSE